MNVVKSVLAVVAGIAAFSAALFGVDAAVGPVAGFQTPGRLFWLAWNAVAMTAGGFVSAWVAPRARVGHAVGMGALQAFMTLAAMFAVHDDAPRWFWMAGIALMVPAAWLGAVVVVSFRRV